MAAPEGAVLETTVAEQIKAVARLNEIWCDHNTSCTISFEPSEVGTLVQEIVDNRYGLKSLAFLPKRDFSGLYPYMPFQEISKAEYESRKKAFDALDIPASLAMGVVERRDTPEGARGCEGTKGLL